MFVVVLLQAAVLLNTWPVFDKYKQSFLMGELLWNFQDFESYECRSPLTHTHRAHGQVL